MRERRDAFLPCLLVVDLGALQLATEVDVDALPFGEEVEGGGAGFAMAVAGGFGAAEGQVYFRTGRAGVDVEDAGVDVLHRPEGAVDVLGEDRGGESVLDPVCHVDRLVERFDG